jgi:hypothetical protein
MKSPTKRSLTGRWRITEMALWDADFIDTMDPLTLLLTAS